MGKLFNAAVGATVGMAKMAGERNRRAYELNNMGVSIAERGDKIRGLDYLYEAESLMPSDEELRRAIRINIRRIEREL